VVRWKQLPHEHCQQSSVWTSDEDWSTLALQFWAQWLSHTMSRLPLRGVMNGSTKSLKYILIFNWYIDSSLLICIAIGTPGTCSFCHWCMDFNQSLCVCHMNSPPSPQWPSTFFCLGYYWGSRGRPFSNWLEVSLMICCSHTLAKHLLGHFRRCWLTMVL